MMDNKLSKRDFFKIVCRFQGHPDIAGMALIETQGPRAMLAAAHWLEAKARQGEGS